MTSMAFGPKPDTPPGEGWLNQFEEKYRDDPDYLAEALALAITEDANEVMEKQGVTRAELAARLGVSRAYVSQMLNARPNMTLRSIAQLAIALHVTPSIRLDAQEPTARGTLPR